MNLEKIFRSFENRAPEVQTVQQWQNSAKEFQSYPTDWMVWW